MLMAQTNKLIERGARGQRLASPHPNPNPNPTPTPNPNPNSNPNPNNPNTNPNLVPMLLLAKDGQRS